MSVTFYALAFLSLAAIVFVVLEFLHEIRNSVWRYGGVNAAQSGNLRSLINSQRVQDELSGEKEKINTANLALVAAAEVDLSRKKVEHHARLTLVKKLRYAKWTISPVQFRLIQVVITLLIFIPAYLQATVYLQVLTIFIVPLLVSAFLEYFVNRRFKAFDQDYPVMLLQFVSMIKTGMNAFTGLETVAKGLDQGSLVRQEIELLVERLRLGLREEQAINAFGEDIPHPEIELFVQSLLIHRRVGGGLSSTLERLARQVRKRQQFRDQAVAAVGLERTSIYAIACILSFLLLYLLYYSPELVLPAFDTEMGANIFQAGLALIIFGFYWSTTVTKIKI